MVKAKTTTSDAGAMRHAPPLDTLPASAAADLLAAASRLTLLPNDTLLCQDEVSPAVYLVQSGILRHIYYNSSGTDAGLGLVASGQWLGLGSLYSLPQSGTIEALIASQVLVIAPHVLQHIMADTPAIAQAFHALTLQQSIDAQKRLCEMMTLSVPERLARCLLRLAQDFGRETEQGLYLDVPLTRAHLADLVGTRFETVSRTLSQWERDGLVRSRRQKIWIVEQGQFATLTGAAL